MYDRARNKCGAGSPGRGGVSLISRRLLLRVTPRSVLRQLRYTGQVSLMWRMQMTTHLCVWCNRLLFTLSWFSTCYHVGNNPAENARSIVWYHRKLLFLLDVRCRRCFLKKKIKIKNTGKIWNSTVHPHFTVARYLYYNSTKMKCPPPAGGSFNISLFYFFV